MSNDDEITGIYEVLDAVEAVIKAADPAKREVLAKTLDEYHEDFPFHWAIGPQAPTFLYHPMMSIDGACRPDQKAARSNSTC
jgi:hypothetical protein